MTFALWLAEALRALADWLDPLGSPQFAAGIEARIAAVPAEVLAIPPAWSFWDQEWVLSIGLALVCLWKGFAMGAKWERTRR